VADLWWALRALDVRLLRLLRTRGHSAPIETAVVRFAQSGENGLIWHGIAAAGVGVHASKRPGYARPSDILAGALLGDALARLLTR